MSAEGAARAEGELRATQALLDRLGLAPHPEGGWYRETHRSPHRVLPRDGRPERSAVTTILFLLEAGQRSRWHAVASEELWRLLEGGPLELVTADPALTSCTRQVLRATPTEGVAAVGAGCWQAARPLGAYALCECIVAPGFEFEDFRMLADDESARAALERAAPEFRAFL